MSDEEKDLSANQKVEETVADLKRKIQQLSEEKEAETRQEPASAM